MWGVKDASGRLLFIAHQIVGGLPCGAPDESAQSLLYARAEIAELEGVVADLDDRLAKPFKRDYERDVVAADKERTLAEIHGWGLLSAWLSAHQPRAVAA